MKSIKCVRWIGGALAAVFLAESIASPQAAEAAKAPLPTALVTMGDSFMSGEGGRWQGNSTSANGMGNGTDRARNGDPATVYGTSYADGCDRSDSSEALSSSILDKQVNIACSGAETVNIFRASQGGKSFKTEKPQADQLAALATKYDVRVIALSIGGNDLGFSAIIEACVKAFLLGRAKCNAEQQRIINQRIAKTTQQVAKAVSEVQQVMTAAGKKPGQYRFILQSAPSPIPRGSEIRYPETYNGRWRTGGCPFYNADATWARDKVTSQIADMQAGVAAKAKIDFLDLRDALQGREVCSVGNSLVQAG